MIVQLALFTQLAASCAPHVAVETLAAVARTESSFDALAMHDNTTGRTFHPVTQDEAIALATELIVAERHSVDLGLMQINSLNFPSLGMTITDAFDPCRSMAGADRVLVQGYVVPAAGSDQQQALHQALSRYNTGDPARGVADGYVRKVQASAEVIVPAIRLRGDGNASPAPLPSSGNAPVLVQPLPPPPASWDVYGQARAARGQGVAAYSPNRVITAPAAVALTVPAAPAPAPDGPVLLRPSTNQQAVNEYR